LMIATGRPRQSSEPHLGMSLRDQGNLPEYG
jgi:hypothetical protein